MNRSNIMTFGGYTDIDDVKKVYDELSIWDKREFILKEIQHIGEFSKDELYEYGIFKRDIATNAREAVQIFGENELLDKMDEDEIRDYCKGWDSPLSFYDVVDILEDYFSKDSKYSSDNRIKYLAEVLKSWDQKDKLIEEIQKT